MKRVGLTLLGVALSVLVASAAVDGNVPEASRRKGNVMKFGENLHTALWGHEEWVCSAHRSAPSVIVEGPHAGKRLDEVYPGFPLLMKVIDAKSRLSVQVHPNEETRKVTGGDPKTEMWCALSDGPIYAGLRPGTTAAQVEAAVASGRFEELLVRHDAKVGDVFFIPGGLVHAIGDGVRLYEVQQSSDTTFRLYDWGRVGKDGKPRELHVAQALKAIDYALPVPVPRRELDTPFFRFWQEDVAGEKTYAAKPDRFLSVFSERTGNLLLPPGESATVGSGHYLLTEVAK